MLVRYVNTAQSEQMMKNLPFLVGKAIDRQVEEEVNTLKQSLKNEKKDFIDLPRVGIKRGKKEFVRRFDMYLIYTDMNQRFGKSKSS